MSDLGNFSQSVLCDAVTIADARRLRSRAMAVSLSLELAVIACLLLWPLLRITVLPGQYTSPPIPVFHPVVRTNPPPMREPEHETPTRATIWIAERFVYQPAEIPPRISTPSVGEPPQMDIGEPNVPTGFGVGTPGTGTASTEPKPQPSAPIKMSGGVMAARLIHSVQPEYPKTAQWIHLTGAVQLRAIIGTDGSVQNLQVVSGNPILVKAAVDAVREWRYQPTLLSGKPAEVETVITVQFQMQ